MLRLDILFIVLMIACAWGILNVKSHISAVVIFGAFSFFSCTFFVVTGALDVAFTEAAVGAVITTVYFMLAIYKTGENVVPVRRKVRGGPNP